MRRGLILLVLLCCLGLQSCRRPPVNVLLVTFDTTRWDHVGYASDREGLTPTLDKLARDGAWFETAIASTPITLPSHTTILTGLEPYRHGVRNNGTYHLSQEAVTLAESLEDRGYRTHAVVSAFVLDSRFGLDRGFARYDDDLTEATKESVFMSRQIKAERTAAKAVDWLETNESTAGPFFLWVHFFDPHADYDPPTEYLESFPDDPYAAEIAYTDAMLGRVIAELERQGLVKNTLVVFLSDHGESLGEHGERTHGIFIYDATIRIPLLIAGPGVPSGSRVRSLARSVDVMPTILDLVGAPIPAGLDGRSLRPLIAGETAAAPAYMESLMPRLNYGWSELRGLRTEKTKVILAPRSEVFDLARDPGEFSNRMVSPADLTVDDQTLFDELRRIEAEDPFSRGEHAEGVIDRGTRAALDALGYTRTEQVSDHSVLPDPKDRIAEFETLADARRLIDEESYREAETVLTDLIALSPANMDAMLALAHVQRQTGKWAQAQSVYEHALEINPNHLTAVVEMARLLSDGGEPDHAEELLVVTLEANPGSLDLLNELGRLHHSTGRMDEAEHWYRQALAKDPSAVSAMLGLADCLEERGDRDAADELLTRAYDHHRGDPETVERLAQLCDLRGEHDRSVELYRQLAGLEPDNPSVWNNLAALHARSQRYLEAAASARRAHELEPDSLEIRANFGTMLVLAGRLEEGVEHLDFVVPRMPDNIYGAWLRAEALQHLGRSDQALAAWKDLAPRDPAAGLQVARLELEAMDEAAARRALEDALDRGGESILERARADPELASLLP